MSQTILMCPPDYFSVAYVINPWMQGHIGATDPSRARTQWQALYERLSSLAQVILQQPCAGLPDLVFTANAGLIYKSTAIVSRFRNPERQGETPIDAACFRDLGYTLADWPDDVLFEGAGDALFDRVHDILWLGFGFRSDARAAIALKQFVPMAVEVLELIDPRFYHLDTCWCPLKGGSVLYYPQAFSKASQRLIESIIAPHKRLAVSEEDALAFACNAVTIDDTIIMNKATPALADRLQQAGFRLYQTPLDEFMKAGGSAKCLSLKLREPERS